jgi:hypothetical protein
VTLEEWFAFGDRIMQAIDDAVSRKLTRDNIDRDILKTHPFSICSVEDLEIAIQIIENVGVETFFGKKTIGESRLWPLFTFMGSVFRAEYENINGDLFKDDWSRIHQTLGALP